MSIEKLKSVLNCHIDGPISRLIMENIHLPPEDTAYLDKVLSLHFTCEPNYVFISSIIVALYIILIYYNNKIAVVPNKYISLIDNWYTVFLVSFVTTLLIMQEKPLIAFILSVIITLLYINYIKKGDIAEILYVYNKIENMNNVKKDNMNCVCSCTPIIEEKPENEKIAEKLISQGEQLIEHAQTAVNKVKQLQETGSNPELTNTLVNKSEVLKTEGNKLILEGEKIKVASVENTANKLITEGVQQVDKGVTHINQGTELINSGDIVTGTKLIEQGKLAQEQGSLLVSTGKQIKNEVQEKIKSLEQSQNNNSTSILAPFLPVVSQLIPAIAPIDTNVVSSDNKILDTKQIENFNNNINKKHHVKFNCKPSAVKSNNYKSNILGFDTNEFLAPLH